MNYKIFIEIIKQLFYIIYNFLIEIIKHSWEPLLTLIIKISILAGIITLICTFVPHNITFLTGISYIGWLTILCVYNLITAKLEDNFNSEYGEVLNKNENEIPEPQTEDDLDSEPVTIKKLKDLISNPNEQEKDTNDRESTRE